MRLVPTSRARVPAERGAILVVVILATLVLLSLGLALSLGASLESVIAAGQVTSFEGRYAAEAGLARATADLAAIADWNLALGGLHTSGFFDCAGGGTRPLAFGGTVNVNQVVAEANCATPAGCSAADLVAVTEERPWGADNPVWRPFACGPLDGLVPGGGSAAPFYLVVLLADDGGDGDGRPWMDQDAGRGAGAGLVWLRSVAVGPAGARQVVQAAIGRDPGPVGPGRVRLVSWVRLR